jgi:hypothetical protein
MRDFGYDFHQTMIAKIEAAQRPLRVRELADFAALYGVEVNELIYAPNRSLAEVGQEIAEIEAHYNVAQKAATAAAQALAQARDRLDQVQRAHAMSSREVAMLEQRLSFLRKEREKLALWSDEEPASSDDFAFDFKPDPFAATTPVEFINVLRRYKIWSGDPSWRSMARLSGNVVVHTTMYAAMKSDSLPRLDIVRAIIIGCGGGEDDLKAFAVAWRRVASSDTTSSTVARKFGEGP